MFQKGLTKNSSVSNNAQPVATKLHDTQSQVAVINSTIKSRVSSSIEPKKIVENSVVPNPTMANETEKVSGLVQERPAELLTKHSNENNAKFSPSPDDSNVIDQLEQLLSKTSKNAVVYESHNRYTPDLAKAQLEKPSSNSSEVIEIVEVCSPLPEGHEIDDLCGFGVTDNDNTKIQDQSDDTTENTTDSICTPSQTIVCESDELACMPKLEQQPSDCCTSTTCQQLIKWQSEEIHHLRNEMNELKTFVSNLSFSIADLKVELSRRNVIGNDN